MGAPGDARAFRAGRARRSFGRGEKRHVRGNRPTTALSMSCRSEGRSPIAQLRRRRRASVLAANVPGRLLSATPSSNTRRSLVRDNGFAIGRCPHLEDELAESEDEVVAMADAPVGTTHDLVPRVCGSRSRQAGRGRARRCRTCMRSPPSTPTQAPALTTPTPQTRARVPEALLVPFRVDPSLSHARHGN